MGEGKKEERLKNDSFTQGHMHRHIQWEWRQELESAFLVTVGP